MTRFTPQWLQSGSYAASQDRRLIGALWPTAASSGCQVSAGSGMTVYVAAGTVAVPTQNGTGTTLCTSDALEQINIAAAPGSGQNRIDLVICRPRGNDLDGGANNDFIFDSIQGVVAASPAVPATPAGTTALAQVYVGGGVAAIGGGNITDVRPGNLAIPIGSPTSTPRGVIAQIVGPATTVSLGTSLTTALTLNAAVVAGGATGCPVKPWCRSRGRRAPLPRPLRQRWLLPERAGHLRPGAERHGGCDRLCCLGVRPHHQRHADVQPSGQHQRIHDAGHRRCLPNRGRRHWSVSMSYQAIDQLTIDAEFGGQSPLLHHRAGRGVQGRRPPRLGGRG